MENKTNTGTSTEQQPPALPAPRPSFFTRYASLLKIAGIFTLILFLQIPLVMVSGLMDERQSRHNEAVSNITETWGSSQRITGPILIVPYEYTETRSTTYTDYRGNIIPKNETVTINEELYLLPDTLDIVSGISTQPRHRSIYETLVYTTNTTLSGHFQIPGASTLNLPENAKIHWSRARLAIGASDLRGAPETLAIDWNNSPVPLEPGTSTPLLCTGIHAKIPNLSLETPIQKFTLTLTLNGSHHLLFTPLGRQNTTLMTAPFPNPNFTGAFLPTKHTITDKHFAATWNLSYYGRSYPQTWTTANKSFDSDALRSSAYGVIIDTEIDNYRTIERSIKYAMLFIALTFAAFFIFEILSSLRLHVLHYALVGAALILFYLALLSLSEFIGFTLAYLVAGTSTTLLVSLYSLSILNSGKRSLSIAAALLSIYALLYFILQMQAYSLLAGTAFLFLVLAILMFATRKFDWFTNSRKN